MDYYCYIGYLNPDGLTVRKLEGKAVNVDGVRYYSEEIAGVNAETEESARTKLKEYFHSLISQKIADLNSKLEHVKTINQHEENFNLF